MKSQKFLSLFATISLIFYTGCSLFQNNSAKDAGENRIQVIRDDKTLSIKAGEKNILSYYHAVHDVPEGVDPLFRRSGFIHPLFSPSGQVLTQIQPGDHYHHYGIWNPWTMVHIQGREVDFWNLGKGLGTVRFAGIDSIRSGFAAGGFRVRQEHVDYKAENEPAVAIEEILDINASIGQVHGQTVWIIDLTTVLKNVLDVPIELDQYRYGGGLGFRATPEWNKDNCTVLTSEGKTRNEADGTRARWCDISGAAGDGRSGVLFLSHPDNYQHPEPMRVWPDNIVSSGQMFFEFCPIRLTSWTLEPRKEYCLRYRMIVYDGMIESETAEVLWKNYLVSSLD